MRVQVRKCPFTGKLFEEKDVGKYILHLLNLRKEKQKLREYAHLKKSFVKWFRDEQEKIVAYDQIAPWIVSNQSRLMKTYNAMYASGKSTWHRPFPEGSKIVSLKLGGRFSPWASNTHSCPRSGVMNFSPTRNPELPNGYPGYVGEVSGKMVFTEKKKYQETPSWSDFFKMIDIHTGTGSGGKEFSYSGSVWVTDWQGLAQELTIAVLKG